MFKINKKLTLIILIIVLLIIPLVFWGKLIIVGGDDTRLYYIFPYEWIKKAKLEKYFIIYGRIYDQEEVNKILFKCGVAIAPYYPEDKNSLSYYADPGKVKVYLGCGLPIVITDVPPIAKTIDKEKGGFIARYDPKDFADKIIQTINQEKEYIFYRKNAIKLGKEIS